MSIAMGRWYLEDTVCASQLASNEGHVLAVAVLVAPLKSSLNRSELLYLSKVPPKTSFSWSTPMVKT